MNRNIIAVILLLASLILITIVIVTSIDFESSVSEEDEDYKEHVSEDQMKELVSCLDEAGVVIYGSVTCPFCEQLANSFGGYDVISSIYVECTEESERCDEEMIGRGVPEIQIKGEIYQGSRDPLDIGREVGCEL